MLGSLMGNNRSIATATASNQALINKYKTHLSKLDGYGDRLGNVEDFPTKHEWLNTKDDQPLSLYKELKGKLVVVDFWSCCCINCIHVLEEMNYLEHTFAHRKEIAFVGCHSAKFKSEKELHMLEQAVVRYDIQHPVFNDKHFQFWES